MSFGNFAKLVALALMAAKSVKADEGGDCVGTTSDFITRTMGHITYTLLRPTTTYDPYPDFIEAADATTTVTATAVETVVSTSVEVLTVVTTTTLSSIPTWTPLTSPVPHLPIGIEKRDVTTVTVYGGYGTPLASTSVTETAMGGDPSTTTVSATSTTTITGTYSGTYSLTYPSGLSTATTIKSATLATTVTTSSISSSGETETTAVSISVSLSSSSSHDTFMTTPTFSSAVSTQSSQSNQRSQTVPAESETSPAPVKPTSTVVSGGVRAVPVLAAVAIMFVFAI
ncbi:hypothetical protein SBRCBS47491_005797 [Sporothrix bragantina]|uniref:Uncharacterized protein n=1 Tax=Sporothrix bragantina TaxID=671064 RepID=A0ABP0BZZ2_9PEZI